MAAVEIEQLPAVARLKPDALAARRLERILRKDRQQPAALFDGVGLFDRVCRHHGRLLRSSRAPAAVRPVVSGRPNSRFIHCTAPPAAPLLRLSIAHNTTTMIAVAATPQRRVVGPATSFTRGGSASDVDERRAGVEPGERRTDLLRASSLRISCACTVTWMPRANGPECGTNVNSAVHSRGGARAGARSPARGGARARCRRRDRCAAADGASSTGLRPAPVLPVTATTNTGGSIRPSDRSGTLASSDRGGEAARMADVAASPSLWPVLRQPRR